MTRSRVSDSLTAPQPAAGPILPPIWKESLWLADWWSLRFSSVYCGRGVPQGDRSPVVLVPGFLGTDAYLFELYFWLGRIGYRPYMSGIGVNAECPGRLTRRLLRTMERARLETGRPVRIIGHSLGGLIGRAACLERPELASQLIYLGSPLQSMRAHPALLVAAAFVRLTLSTLTVQQDDCLTEQCRCGFAQQTPRPLPGSIHHAAIFSQADGVVDWHDSQEPDPRLNHEVGGTHIGLVYNPRAYRVLAELLAEAA